MIQMKSKIPDSFGRLAKKFTDYKNSEIAILPVPFDKTSSWIKGSSKGPKAIIEASQYMEFYDIETDSEVYKKGVYTEKDIRASSSELMIDKVHEKVKKLIKDKKFVVALGGEHSISIGLFRAYSEFFNYLSIFCSVDIFINTKNPPV